MALTGQADPCEMGVLPVESGEGDERDEYLPAFLFQMPEEARRGASKVHQIQMAIACQIHQALPTLLLEANRVNGTPRAVCGLAGLTFRSGVPVSGLFRQKTRYALAVQIDPLIAGAIESVGKGFQASGFESGEGLVNGCCGICGIGKLQGVAPLWQYASIPWGGAPPQETKRRAASGLPMAAQVGSGSGWSSAPGRSDLPLVCAQNGGT